MSSSSGSENNDTSNHNNDEEHAKRMSEAVKFINNYYSTKDHNTSLAVSDLETTIDNLVIVCNFLFSAVTKLIDIQLAGGNNEITSLSKNIEESMKY